MSQRATPFGARSRRCTKAGAITRVRRGNRRRHAADFELPDAARRRPFDDVADAAADKRGADWSQDRDAIALDIGVFRQRDRVFLDFARTEVFGLDRRVHGDDVRWERGGVDDCGAVQFITQVCERRAGVRVKRRGDQQSERRIVIA